MGSLISARAVKRLLSFACLMSFVATCLAMNSDDPADWLAMMVEARKTQNYEGTIVYSRGQDMSSMRLLHRYKNGIEQERLVALDGEPREIIRKDDHVICIFPGNKQVRLEQSLPVGPLNSDFSDIVPLKEAYSIHVAGIERLSGYEVVKVAIIAKDQFRYSYLLWLEKQTGLLMKSILTGAQGEVLEHFQFTDLRLGSTIPDEAFAVDAGGVLLDHSDDAGNAAMNVTAPLSHRWQLKWLPDGFKHADYVTGRDSVLPESSRTQVYSDGLAMFSVFVEPQSATGIPEGASRMGATSAYTRHKKVADTVYAVTVVGEVPVQTAKKVANQLRILDGMPQ